MIKLDRNNSVASVPNNLFGSLKLAVALTTLVANQDLHAQGSPFQPQLPRLPQPGLPQIPGAQPESELKIGLPFPVPPNFDREKIAALPERERANLASKALVSELALTADGKVLTANDCPSDLATRFLAACCQIPKEIKVTGQLSREKFDPLAITCSLIDSNNVVCGQLAFQLENNAPILLGYGVSLKGTLQCLAEFTVTPRVMQIVAEHQEGFFYFVNPPADPLHTTPGDGRTFLALTKQACALSHDSLTATSISSTQGVRTLSMEFADAASKKLANIKFSVEPVKGDTNGAFNIGVVLQEKSRSPLEFYRALTKAPFTNAPATNAVPPAAPAPKRRMLAPNEA